MSDIVKHIVWFKLKEGFTEDQMDSVRDVMRTLRDIPCVADVEFGSNMTQRTVHEICLIAHIEGKDNLSVYADHPIHKQCVADLKEFVDLSQTLAADFVNEL